jgi:Na+/H+-dicarboxylate symporter
MPLLSKLPLYVKIILGMFIGCLLGMFAVWLGWEHFVGDWIKPWGTIFIKMLKLIAVPLVFVSLIKGIGGLSDISKLSRIGLKTISLYIVTTVLAICVGLLLVNFVKPGKTFPEEKTAELQQLYGQSLTEKHEAAKSVKEESPLKFLVEMVPDNIIKATGDNSKMLQVIFFAILFGVGMLAVGNEKSGTVKKFFDEIDHIILKIIDYVMLFAPYGVLALMAGLIVDFAGDIDLFSALGLYAVTVVVGLFIMTYVIYPIFIKLFTPVKYKDFFKAISPVQLLAFSSSSSAATLPLTMEQVENELKVHNDIASFVLPVGVTINMDGTSCYQAIAAIFIAQVFGIELTIGQMMIIVLTATLSSIGTPGIPGGSIVMLIVVLTAVGIPVEGLALIMGIDRPLDMMRTVVNVTGDSTVATVVAVSEKKLG